MIVLRASGFSTVAEAVEGAVERLERGAVSNASFEARQIVRRILGVGPGGVECRARDPWSTASQTMLDSFLGRRLLGTPLAYVLGEWDFLDMTLVVTPDVLVPRPETEELFEWMKETVFCAGGPTSLADVGTGAGGLALAMARRWGGVTVTATDLSSSALAVARWNARCHGVESRVRLCRADLLPESERTFDGIVANLPYVATSDWAALSAETRGEPRSALDGGPDGLRVVDRLLPRALSSLRPGGVLFLEVGFDQAARVRERMKSVGFSGVEIRRDFAGIERLVKGVR